MNNENIGYVTDNNGKLIYWYDKKQKDLLDAYIKERDPILRNNQKQKRTKTSTNTNRSDMKGKVIILNGPPGSGKDTIAEAMSDPYARTHPITIHLEVKAKLFEQAMEISGIGSSDWHLRYNDRKLKETPWSRLGGLSQREFLIKISEEWVKPIFGKDYYGKAAVEAAADELLGGHNVVFSDGGFQEEFDTIKSIVGKGSILLVRLYREGTNWDGDSRGYLKNPDWEVDIENNGTVQEVINDIKREL